MAEAAIHHLTRLPVEATHGVSVDLDALPSSSLQTNLLPTVAARLKAAQWEECHFLFYRDAGPVGHHWFVGEHDRVAINIRDLFHNALNQGATRFFIAHNHPSGNPSPTRTDVQLTSHLCLIGKALGVLAFDHVIFARDRHFSFRAEGLM